MTQANIIKSFLRSDPNRWFKSYELIKVNTPYGWLGSGADRQARALAEKGLVERRSEGKYAEYKYKPTMADMVIARANEPRPLTLQFN